jgi:hypothetical protein
MNGTRKPLPASMLPAAGAPGPSNRQKGFADMPKEAQDIARDMVERKVIKSTDDYARNYFANLEGRHNHVRRPQPRARSSGDAKASSPG